MKKLLISAAFLLSFVSAAQAQDRVAMETAMPSSALTSMKDSGGGFIVTGTDKLITKPGSVFAQGGNYEGIDLPYLVSTPKPIEYPRWALRQGLEGYFVIAVEVLTDGTVGRYHVMESTGHKALDEAATKAVRTWKFHPAMKNGQPIVECVQIPVTFKIGE